MSSSWKNLCGALICLLSVVGTVCIVYWAANIPPKPQPQLSPTCDVGDTLVLHQTNDPPAVCPDPRQKLTITREGPFMGVYEYRCHCN